LNTKVRNNLLWFDTVEDLSHGEMFNGIVLSNSI